MPTLLDLYKNATSNKAENELYGKEAPRIESKGAVNLPRTIGLLASSPNSLADLIGSQGAKIIKGYASRPSDTIFNGPQFYRKPITLSGGVAVSQGKIGLTLAKTTSKPYFVKPHPAPKDLPGLSIPSIVKEFKKDPTSAAVDAGIDLLRNPATTIKAIKAIGKSIKKRKKGPKGYGTPYMIDSTQQMFKDSEKGEPDKKFSYYAPTYKNSYNFLSSKQEKEYIFDGTVAREVAPDWNLINLDVIKWQKLNLEQKNTFTTNYENNKITYVEIKQLGKTQKIVLPGTISGLSEDFSPEWTNFKYIGSPFMNYRYSGIERSIKFNVKMYYTDQESKESMILSLDKLRELVFPYDELSVISYGENTDKQTKALAFSPNLVNFSITGLYTNLFGFVEELSFTIDDNVSWATTDMDMIGNKTAPYPTVIDVSIGFKVITNVDINNNKAGNTLVYRFTNAEKILPKDAVAKNKIEELLN